jgi:hypothetical protein
MKLLPSSLTLIYSWGTVLLPKFSINLSYNKKESKLKHSDISKTENTVQCHLLHERHMVLGKLSTE